MNSGSRLENLKAGMRSSIIRLNRSCGTRTNPRHYAPPITCDGKDCPKCFGIVWVFESHPDRAWHHELGCMCGAGMTLHLLIPLAVLSIQFIATRSPTHLLELP